MKTVVLICLSTVLLLACAIPPATLGEGRTSGISSDITLRPKARPDSVRAALGIKPPESARTVEALDTTTAAEKRAALETESATGERSLGRTIASLGSPSDPGFWLKTPLVRSETQGRVVLPGTQKSVQVTLIPIDGPETAGSRISLPALRLLEAPLTGLSEVEVFAES